MSSPYHHPIPSLPDPSTLFFPANLVRQCSDCDLHLGCNSPVPGDGSIPAYVMFLGQNPGKEEDEWGKPFIGRAGQQLESLLLQCGINRESVYMTNVVKCLTRSNSAPRPPCVQSCSKWLNLELELVQPKVIMAMGAFAIRSLLGEDAGTVEHLHGRPIDKDGRIILPCYHPAAGLHDTSTLRFLYDDFQVLRGLLSGKSVDDYTVKDEYPNPNYKVVEDVGSMATDMAFAEQTAVDTETVKRGSELWSVQMSVSPGTGWFFPIKQGYRGKADMTAWGIPVIVHNYLHDINWLAIPDNNFLDTMIMAYLLGLPQGLKELATRLCGMNMVSYAEVVRPGRRKMSLDYLTEASKREWPDPPDVEETKWDNKQGKVITRVRKPWHISRKITKILADTVASIDTDPYDRWGQIPLEERECVEKVLGEMPESSLADIKFEDAVQYATRDADATLRVKLKMDKLMQDAGLDFVLHMDTAILPMVHEMMQTGMAVDLDHIRNLSAEYDARMRGKAVELSSLVGHPFNPNSRPQVASVIYQELGFKQTRSTPSGDVSTDDQELKKTGHPVAKRIIEYRRLSKMKGTYADNLAYWAIPDSDGVPRVHTTLKTTRTETGRLSSAEPLNLQNIPTRSKEGKVVRNGFIAPNGWLLGEGDYAQIEMVVQAHMAMCKGLIDLFNRGEDPHTVTASHLFGVPYEEAAKEKYRYPTKRANFGIIYMIGARGLSGQIQEYIADLEMEGEPVDVEPWTEQDCEKFIADWYNLYPEVREYQMEMAAQARRYGYVSDMFGRIRYIPEVSCPVKQVQETGLKMAANMPIQAGAQGIIKLAMGELWRELPRTGWRDRVKWLMQIHDSLIVELRDDDEFVRGYLGWMRKVMCGVVKLVVPVRVDFKTGRRWGELEKVSL